MKSLDYSTFDKFSFLLSICALTFAGCSQPPIQAPTSYASYNAKDGTFQCEYPEGWLAEGGGGKRSPVWAKFTSGPAMIRVRGDVTGSLLGDLAGGRTPDSQFGDMPELAPVHGIHDDVGKEQAMADFEGYTETAGPDVLDVTLGPARRSEFTASTTFGGKIHGYRVTVLGHNKRVVAFCTCPESDWATLKPAFEHVLGTLQRGYTE